jgi:hypothetical protein
MVVLQKDSYYCFRVSRVMTHVDPTLTDLYICS